MLRFLGVACISAVAILAGPAAAEPTDGGQTTAASKKVEPSSLQKIAAQEDATAPVEAPQQAKSEEKSEDKSSDGAEPAISAAAKASVASKDEKPAAAPPPAKTLSASIDLAKQRMVVSENGQVKHSWPISSGTEEFATPRGTFQPQWVSKMWYSRKYDNAPMPNAVFISGGVAIHGTPHVRSLGRPASHGCIRLAPTNAKTFYALVQKHGLKHTKVAVYGTPKWQSPAVASRGNGQRYSARQYNGSRYRAVSAYDPGFMQGSYRKSAPSYYTYPGDSAPRAYRSYGGKKYVYVQRPQRRYYYNSYGFGW